MYFAGLASIEHRYSEVLVQLRFNKRKHQGFRYLKRHKCDSLARSDSVLSAFLQMEFSYLSVSIPRTFSNFISQTFVQFQNAD